MPKLKTRKSAAKRFKVLRQEAEVDKTMEKRVRKLIPYL